MVLFNGRWRREFPQGKRLPLTPLVFGGRYPPRIFLEVVRQKQAVGASDEDNPAPRLGVNRHRTGLAGSRPEGDLRSTTPIFSRAIPRTKNRPIRILKSSIGRQICQRRGGFTEKPIDFPW